jgi:hypothetical protein
MLSPEFWQPRLSSVSLATHVMRRKGKDQKLQLLIICSVLRRLEHTVMVLTQIRPLSYIYARVGWLPLCPVVDSVCPMASSALEVLLHTTYYFCEPSLSLRKGKPMLGSNICLLRISASYFGVKILVDVSRRVGVVWRWRKTSTA